MRGLKAPAGAGHGGAQQVRGWRAASVMDAGMLSVGLKALEGAARPSRCGDGWDGGLGLASLWGGAT